MPNKRIDLIAEFEQLEQAVIEIAKVIHSYYEQLVKSGLDPEFARELAQDLANVWWSTLIGNR